MFGSKHSDDVDLNIKKSRKVEKPPSNKVRKVRRGRKVRPKPPKVTGSRDILYPDRSEKNWVMNSSVDCEVEEYPNFANSLKDLDPESYSMPGGAGKLPEFKVTPHEEKMEGENELLKVKEIFRLESSEFHGGYTSVNLYKNLLILGGLSQAEVAVYDISQLQKNQEEEGEDDGEGESNKGIKLVNVLKGPVEKASNQIVSICVINDEFMVTGEGSNGNLSIWKDYALPSKYQLVGYYQVHSVSYSDRMTGKKRHLFSGVLDTCRLGNESTEFIAVVNRDGENKRMIRIWNWKKGQVVQKIPIDSLNLCNLYYVGQASNLLACYNHNEVLQIPLKEGIIQQIEQQQQDWLPFAHTHNYTLHNINNRKSHMVSYSKEIDEKYQFGVQSLVEREACPPYLLLSSSRENENEKVVGIEVVDGESVVTSERRKLIKQTIFQKKIDKKTGSIHQNAKIQGLVSSDDGKLIIGSFLRTSEVVFIVLE